MALLDRIVPGWNLCVKEVEYCHLQVVLLGKCMQCTSIQTVFRLGQSATGMSLTGYKLGLCHSPVTLTLYSTDVLELRSVVSCRCTVIASCSDFYSFTFRP